jgi:signal transduction histidine kinase
MSWLVRSDTLRLPVGFDSLARLRFPLCVFFAYWAGAELAFFIGTLSDKVFAPFWPPNIVLLCALLYAPHRKWECLLAAFLAHALAEMGVGMPALQLVVAFATNWAFARLSAMTLEALSVKPPWFDSFRKAVIFVVFVGFLWPSFVAFGGAFVPILGGGSLDRYWDFWLQWCASNVLGSMTLGPIALILVSDGLKTFNTGNKLRQGEAVIVAVVLVGACEFSFQATSGFPKGGFLPSLLYAPIPLLAWSAARFGTKGASTAILFLAFFFIWRTLNGESIFLTDNREHNVLALQLFLVSLAVPALLLGASRDIGANSEQRLRDDEESMEFVAAAVDIGFWRYNLDTRSLWTTDHCRTMFAIDKLAVTPADFISKVHADDRRLVEEIMTSDTYNLDAPSSEFRVAASKDKIKWMLANSHARSRSNGDVPEISGFFRDITAFKNAEAERELQSNELAHLMRVSQVGELSGGLAHELTQPLTSILANAEAAREMLKSEKPDFAEIANALDDIVQEDNRAGDVISRLRALLKTGETSVALIDINELVKAALQLLRNELTSRHIKTEIALLNKAVIVSGDPVQLQQVVVNLVMNAIDAVSNVSRHRRHILVKTECLNDDMVDVTVRDNGTGLDIPAHRQVFEPFFTTKERGLGLGLYISSMIIKRYGGSMSLDGNSDGGATACFRLPIYRVKGRVS